MTVTTLLSRSSCSFDFKPSREEKKYPCHVRNFKKIIFSSIALKEEMCDD